MTRIGLKWKKPAKTGPVYLNEAADLLGTTWAALRARVHMMMNHGHQDSIPKPLQEPDGHRRWYWERDEFMEFVKTKRQLDKIVQGGKP